jgi:hypothetical protein
VVIPARLALVRRPAHVNSLYMSGRGASTPAGRQPTPASYGQRKSMPRRIYPFTAFTGRIKVSLNRR